MTLIKLAVGLIVLELVVSARAVAGEPDCSLILSAAKTTMKVGEDLKVEVTMTNSTDHDVFYKADFPPFMIEVRDNDNKKVSETEYGRKVHGKNRPGGSYFAMPMHPGESIRRQPVLSQEFDLSQPGKYSIQAIRQVDDMVVKSNMVSITVVPVIGDAMKMNVIQPPSTRP